MPDPAITLHGTKLSGHAHRIELLLRMLGLSYVYRDAPAAVRRTPAFLALNPLGQVPVLEDGRLVLADSNAILIYLAQRYDPARHWLPETPEGAAAVQRWLSIAAGEVSFGPAAARAITLWNMRPDVDPVRARVLAGQLLAFMDGHLASPRTFLAASHPTIADLACYSYIAHAPEGGIPLDPYPAVRAWLGRVEALPSFEPMPRSPLPEAV
ncbi:glutathione S-transferase family protein [Novosphingopyxis sp.]|uniref:glutathione S-transferase family protein n=1 Tax=Novosphingopyxis sp. TaxID=2709690 RepID=UPI003B5AC2D7